VSITRSISRMFLCALAAATIGASAAGAATYEGGTSPTQTPAGTRANPTLVAEIATARAATAKYVSNLSLAQKNGYGIITKMIPNMGYHYMNPNVKGFDVRKPPILVYEHHGSTWQLGALEWVFTSKPAKPFLPGATYGAFGAGCHYKDGTFYPSTTQGACPTTAPNTGAAFNFWHPNLVTMHVWLWYPNPTGLFTGTNPLVTAFNRG
jgi:hypothetical protein